VKIIEDILDVSRIITGKLRVDPKPMDLVAITRDAIEVVRPSALAKQLSVELGPHAERCFLVGDPERLQQVVWNLLSNAVKFTDAGGSIRITTEQEGSVVVLTVTDTGKGIEPELLPFVFDRFRQGDASTTRRVGGLGLGLALVRHIMELHGGSVTAESAGLFKGSTFRITLPIRAVVEDAPPQTRSSPQATATAGRAAGALRGVRVLVVDDDADARELLSSVLVEAGATVETSRSTAEGFEAVRRFRPHLFVSDIGMPEADGYELAARVRGLQSAEGGSIPSIALTAYARGEDRTKALAAGFTLHIGKPVSPDDLIWAVERLVTEVPP